jgi:hypothetical protein
VNATTQTYAEIRRGHQSLCTFKKARGYQQGVLGLEENAADHSVTVLDNDFVRTGGVSVSRLDSGHNDVSLLMVADGNLGKLSKILKRT